jgi:hypothetical protein
MFELPIVSRHARDLVEDQFGAGRDERDERGPAPKRRVRPAKRRTPRSA